MKQHYLNTTEIVVSAGITFDTTSIKFDTTSVTFDQT